MSAAILPLIPSVPSYRVGTVLGGSPYILDVRWNGRAAAWFMDLLAPDETPIRVGMKLVLGNVLGSRVADARMPGGAFVIADLSNAGLDATLDDMGTRVIVYYVTRGAT